MKFVILQFPKWIKPPPPPPPPPRISNWPKIPHALGLTYPIQKCNICYNKLAKILIFDSFCLESFSAKQCQKWLVQQSQKLVKVIPHAQQQLLILWSDILTMKCTLANFIDHLWAKISMKITFHRSRKDISLIWVGFFQQSIGVLWLSYQVLYAIKWFLGLNNWNGRAVPSRFGFV